MRPDLIKTNHEAFADAHRKAAEALLSLQREDGHWCGELQGDSMERTTTARRVEG